MVYIGLGNLTTYQCGVKYTGYFHPLKTILSNEEEYVIINYAT